MCGRGSVPAGFSAALLLLMLVLLIPAVTGTEVRWINPERGPMKGGTGVMVKGLDFKHSGLGELSCKFHRITVPAQVVSPTLIKCSSPGIDKPAQVEVTVVEKATGRRLPGQELIYEYYNCDASECHIGHFVPNDAQLLDVEEVEENYQRQVSGALEQTGKPSEAAAAQVEAAQGARVAASAAGDEDGWGPADEVEEGHEAEDRARSVEYRSALKQQQQQGQQGSSEAAPVASEAAPRQQQQQQGQQQQQQGSSEAAPGASEAAPRQQQGQQQGHQRAMTAEERILQERRRRKQQKQEEERRRREEEEEAAAARAKAKALEEEEEDDGINVWGMAVLGCVGLYALRLARAALWGPGRAKSSASVVLPEVSAAEKRRSLDLKHVDPNGSREMLVRTDSVNTTCSSPALERANSLRPNERGVRKQANLRMGSSYGDEDEKASLGHLRWLMGADGQALQKLQALLSSLKGEPLYPDELLIKLQAFDAQRLLHSPTVCTQALVDAGISKEEAKDVATALYTPGTPLTQASAPTSPYKTTSSAASTPPGSPTGQTNHSRRTLSAGLPTPAPMRGPSPSRLRPSGGSAGQTLTNPNVPTASLGPSAKPSLPPPRIALPRGSTAATTVRLHQQQQHQEPLLAAAVPPPASSAPLRTSSLPVTYATNGSLSSSPHESSVKRSSSGSIKPPTVDPIDIVSSDAPSINVHPLTLKQPDTPPGSPTSAVPRSPSSPSPRDDDTAADNDWESPRVNGFSRRAAPWKEATPVKMKDELHLQHKQQGSPSSSGMVPSAVFTAMRPPSALNGRTSASVPISNDSFSPAGSGPRSLAGTPPRTPAPRPRIATGANAASPITPLQRSPSDS